MISFTAATTTGAGRGKGLGTPTINLNLEHVPAALEEGIYACMANGQPAVMHYGPRPVFRDSTTCEVHFLDTTPPPDLAELSVQVLERIRDVRDFPTPDALKKQIEADILHARAVIKNEK
ncbi:MAG: riboflavin kinase [Candidatus Peribacteraceae bacterium]|nr:riboflavin kinase [Candidatus Peribacteraceae bacterium]